MAITLHRLTTDGIISEQYERATDALARWSERAASGEEIKAVSDGGADLDMSDVEQMAMREDGHA